MSDQPCNQKWTIETVREHVLSLLAERDRQYDQRFIAQEKAVQTAMNAAERAVSKAETAAEKRFDAVNEFRATLADQQRTLMPRAEAELQFGRITSLEKELTTMRGHGSGIHSGWGYAIGLVGIILAVAALIWKVSP